MANLTPKDEDLIALLRVNAREPVAALARKLGLSRTTVQDRLRRLEENGTIAGYSVRLGGEKVQDGIRAFITIAIEPKKQIEAAKLMMRYPQVEALHTVSGKYDLVAQVKAGNSEAMDKLIDELGAAPGVTRVETAVILSTKLDRR
jgi:DNA-binding Lrp family transcriptional regulator